MGDVPLSSSTPDQDRNKIARPTSSRFAQALPNGAEIERRLERAGTRYSIDQFLAATGVLFVITLLPILVAGAPILLGLSLGVAVALYLPQAFLNRLIRRRSKAFIDRFPDALDLMVRGLRSGFPVAEVVDLVASELDGPVGEEFRVIGDNIRIGMTLEGALRQVENRLAIQEFRFFGIAVAIQRQTGGNLGETLNNLSDVLRKRAQMRLKITALTSEARASGVIVGILPFFVGGMLSFLNPAYLSPFLTDTRLTITAVCALIWMGIGAFIMAKMADLKI
ncbi:MAG: type II secretion system F family protein [Chakrabartia sp.]